MDHDIVNGCAEQLIRWFHLVMLLSAIWQAATKHWEGAFWALVFAYVSMVIITYINKKKGIIK